MTKSFLKKDDTLPLEYLPNTQYLKDVERWSVKGKIKILMKKILNIFDLILPPYIKK